MNQVKDLQQGDGGMQDSKDDEGQQCDEEGSGNIVTLSTSEEPVLIR